MYGTLRVGGGGWEGWTEWHMQHMEHTMKGSSRNHTRDQLRHNESNLKLKTTVGFYCRGEGYFQTPTCLNKRATITAWRITGPKAEVILLHWVTGGYQNSLAPLRRNLLWTEEVGVCRDSDTCEERLLELKMPLTKLPRRTAVGERRGWECVVAEMLKQGGHNTCACIHVRSKAEQTEKREVFLIFFTERKAEKLDIVCHRDTEMLLMNHCNQMEQQQITNGRKKNGWTHKRKACFVSTAALKIRSLRLQWWVWRLGVATSIEASNSSRGPHSSISGNRSYLSHPRLLWWCWHSPRTPGKQWQTAGDGIAARGEMLPVFQYLMIQNPQCNVF